MFPRSQWPSHCSASHASRPRQASLFHLLARRRPSPPVRPVSCVRAPWVQAYQIGLRSYEAQIHHPWALCAPLPVVGRRCSRRITASEHAYSTHNHHGCSPVAWFDSLSPPQGTFAHPFARAGCLALPCLASGIVQLAGPPALSLRVTSERARRRGVGAPPAVCYYCHGLHDPCTPLRVL